MTNSQCDSVGRLSAGAPAIAASDGERPFSTVRSVKVGVMAGEMRARAGVLGGQVVPMLNMRAG